MSGLGSQPERSQLGSTLRGGAGLGTQGEVRTPAAEALALAREACAKVGALEGQIEELHSSYAALLQVFQNYEALKDKSAEEAIKRASLESQRQYRAIKRAALKAWKAGAQHQEDWNNANDYPEIFENWWKAQDLA